MRIVDVEEVGYCIVGQCGTQSRIMGTVLIVASIHENQLEMRYAILNISQICCLFQSMSRQEKRINNIFDASSSQS